jgi:hypothetical protein
MTINPAVNEDLSLKWEKPTKQHKVKIDRGNGEKPTKQQT